MTTNSASNEDLLYEQKQAVAIISITLYNMHTTPNYNMTMADNHTHFAYLDSVGFGTTDRHCETMLFFDCHSHPVPAFEIPDADGHVHELGDLQQ